MPGKRSKEGLKRHRDSMAARLFGVPEYHLLKRYNDNGQLGEKFVHQNKNHSPLEHNLLAQHIREHQLKQIRCGVSKQDRDLLITKSGGCFLCGRNDYPEALVIHHKDRNRKNNVDTNLVVLCRTCHWLIHQNLRTL